MLQNLNLVELSLQNIKLVAFSIQNLNLVKLLLQNLNLVELSPQSLNLVEFSLQNWNSLMSVCFIKSNYNSVFIIIAGGLSSTSLYKLRNKIGRRGPVNQAKVEVGARLFSVCATAIRAFQNGPLGSALFTDPLLTVILVH